MARLRNPHRLILYFFGTRLDLVHKDVGRQECLKIYAYYDQIAFFSGVSSLLPPLCGRFENVDSTEYVDAGSR